MREGLSKRLWDAKDKNGIDGLLDVVNEEGKKQLFFAKKNQEFQSDKTTQNDLGAAETMMKLVREELVLMSKSTELSKMEADAIIQVGKDAREREAYNRIYAVVIAMARAG